MDEDMEPEKLKEILSIVSTEIPKLVDAITKTMYNMENADNMAKAVAQFYKSMKEAGMDEKQAYALTQEFMTSFSLGGIIGKALSRGEHDECDDRDEIDKYIQAKIEKKMKKLDKDLGDDD